MLIQSTNVEKYIRKMNESLKNDKPAKADKSLKDAAKDAIKHIESQQPKDEQEIGDWASKLAKDTAKADD